MAQVLTDVSIYTIVNEPVLAAAFKRGGESRFKEKREWKTGLKLWQDALADNRQMPVLFGDASDCSRLIYWGVLTEIKLVESGTEYRVANIQKIRGNRSPQELILRSTRKPIAPGFIRPYAICETPSFLIGS